MLSFELSVIDIVLVIAVIVLLLLYITKTSTKYVAETEPSNEKKKPREEPKTNIALSRISKRKEASQDRLFKSSMQCPHHLGYLATLPSRSSIPEDCYSCPQMMQCLFSSE